MTKYHVITWTVIEASSFQEAESIVENIEHSILNIEKVVSVATIEIDGGPE